MLAQAMVLQIRESMANQNVGNLFSPADGRYFRMFAAGTNVAKGEISFPIQESGFVVEDWEPREYSPESDHDLIGADRVMA